MQRLKIYSYLLSNNNHPTIDMIYEDLIEEIPTLSKMTIYNTMKSFIEKDIVHLITIEENETRYDATMTKHGHFKCKKCGSIFDVMDSRIEEFSLKIPGSKIENIDIFAYGICPACSK